MKKKNDTRIREKQTRPEVERDATAPHAQPAHTRAVAEYRKEGGGREKTDLGDDREAGAEVVEAELENRQAANQNVTLVRFDQAVPGGHTK